LHQCFSVEFGEELETSEWKVRTRQSLSGGKQFEACGYHSCSRRRLFHQFKDQLKIGLNNDENDNLEMKQRISEFVNLFQDKLDLVSMNFSNGTLETIEKVIFETVTRA
jgi:hypothetical protein